jgi:hypothetical protein
MIPILRITKTEFLCLGQLPEKIMNNVLRGTCGELAGRVALFGVPLSQADLGFLTRMGEGKFATRVDTIRQNTGRGGKPATVWEFKPNIKLMLEEIEGAPKKRGAAKKTAAKAAKAKSGEPSTADLNAPVTRGDLEDIITRAVQKATKKAA